METIFIFFLVAVLTVIAFYSLYGMAKINMKEKNTDISMDNTPVSHKITIPEGLGELGEYWCFTHLKNELPNNGKYTIRHDITLGNEKRSTQIDFLVISVYGIFIIEVKNWMGKIYGSETDKTWTVYFHGRKKSYHNPTKQNQSHENALQYLLSKLRRPFPTRTITVFPNTTDISQVKCPHEVVLHMDELVPYIMKFKTPILDDTLFKTTIKKIESNNRKDLKEQHIRYVKRVQHYNA